MKISNNYSHERDEFVTGYCLCSFFEFELSDVIVTDAMT